MTRQPPPSTHHVAPAWERFAARLADAARASAVFADVQTRPDLVEAAARDAGAPAWYRVFPDAGRVWVALVTPDRYLSQSIEQDLVHTGDKLPDLLEEELLDLGYARLGHPSALLPVEHFRDDQKLFTFRSPLPIDPARLDDPAALETARIALLAYEATFRRLGDMEAAKED
jgi:hypothetical protein